MKPSTELSSRYLDLLKMCLLGSHTIPTELAARAGAFGDRGESLKLPATAVQAQGLRKWFRRRLAKMVENRFQGKEFPLYAETMIGRPRLDNIQLCVEQAIANNVSGDLIETGVWRGGAVIFMRGILKAYGITDRKVWVADSFQGLPPPSTQYPADRHLVLDEMDVLRVSLDEVKANFRKYDLLDEQVEFLKGWFEDTLPRAPIEKLAVMRLDGDMYSSTMNALEALYHRLSPGGYVIVDDYLGIKSCRQAVEDFRSSLGITEPIATIDWTGVFWQKEGDAVAGAASYGKVHGM